MSISSVKMSVADLLAAIDLVGPCANRDPEDARTYLKTLCIQEIAHGARCVATDGHRLATLTPEITPQFKNGKEIVIPATLFSQIRAALNPWKREGFAVTISNSKEAAQIELSHPEIKGIAAPLGDTIATEYADWQKVIPNGVPLYRAGVEAADLIQLLSPIAAACKFLGIAGTKFIFSKNGIRAEVSSFISDLKITAGIGIREFIGPDHIETEAHQFEIGFNVHYLLDMARAVHKKNKYDRIMMEFYAANQPAKFSNLYADLLFVVMPIRSAYFDFLKTCLSTPT